MLRKYIFNADFFKSSDNSIPLLWTSPEWNKNKKKLRAALKNYPMTWKITTLLGEPMVTRQYVDSIVQEFAVFCFLSEKMYEKTFSVADLTHDFLSNCEVLLTGKIETNPKVSRQTKRLLDVFDESLALSKNRFRAIKRVFGVILKNVEKADRRKLEENLLRTLYEHERANTKSVKNVERQLQIIRQKKSKK